MYKPATQRRWGYIALPVLHDARLAGKLEAAADRRSGVLRVNAVHCDVRFTKAMTAYVGAEIVAQADWLGLWVQRSGPVWAFGPASKLSVSQREPLTPLIA
jgi:hypothetical protein